MATEHHHKENEGSSKHTNVPRDEFATTTEERKKPEHEPKREGEPKPAPDDGGLLPGQG